jgi:hypothetical protein
VGGVLFEWGMGLPFLVAGVLNLLSIVLAFLFFQTKASPLDQESTEEARL